MPESDASEKKATFGTCAYGRTSPPGDQLSPRTGILKVVLSFEDALQLNVAIDECVRKLNRYKRGGKVGKRAGLKIAIHLHQRRISVHEGKL